MNERTVLRALNGCLEGMRIRMRTRMRMRMNGGRRNFTESSVYSVGTSPYSECLFLVRLRLVRVLELFFLKYFLNRHEDLLD